MYTHVFSTLKPSAVNHFLPVDSQVAFPIVDCARSRLHGSLASGYGAPSAGRWLFLFRYGCGSKWKTDVGPQMEMSSLVFTIQLLGYLILTHTHMFIVHLNNPGWLYMVRFTINIPPMLAYIYTYQHHGSYLVRKAISERK